ncbi:MAG: JAB domain-containing protein, partial [Deltaproteobacteria bacterium]|nr:JAB domain-containing protein [Deltaproteobacteria bacterium]
GAAIAAGCVSIALVHNHPSGSLEPSALDSALTRQLLDGAHILGLKITDHIIITAVGHTSMRQQGQVPFD